jgi:subtilisin family serine protease
MSLSRLPLVVITSLASTIASVNSASAQPSSLGQNVPTELPEAGLVRPRLEIPKLPLASITGEDISAAQYNFRQIVVKFREGTGVRLVEGRGLTSASPSPERLRKLSLSQAQVESDLKAVATLLRNDGWSVYRYVSSLTPEQIDEKRAQAESNSANQLADLNLYYSFYRGQPDAALAKTAVAALLLLPSVEIAYVQPIPKDADIAPSTTIDLRGSQGYAGPMPIGIDTTFANTLPGGKGKGVRIVDVEGGWINQHEDQPSFNFTNGLSFGDGNHGTAVVGVLAARSNEYGITGLVPEAEVGWSSVVAAGFPNVFYSPANAIMAGANWLRAGDVMLIEQHYPGPTTGLSCNTACGNCSQFGYVAMEYFPAEFDAISLATALNIVVVEAAGNGQMGLGAARYQNRFNRQTRDSGAILVGASSSTLRSPMCWSNSGARVDVHGWGQNVSTLGYGTNAGGSASNALRANGSDNRQFYTRSFAGTSSATPIVASAATALQGINKARRSAILTPREIRSLLASTGTPQADTMSRAIGPLPDLVAAVAALPTPTNSLGTVVRVVGNVTSTGDVRITITARNDGGTTWDSNHGFFLRVSGGVSTRMLRFAQPVPPGGSATLQTSVVCPGGGDVRFVATLLENTTQAFGSSRGLRVGCVLAN